MSMERLAGIPGTVGGDARRIQWIRQPDFTRDCGPGLRVAARVYEAQVPDGKLTALVAQEPAAEGGRLLWHVSVSHRDREDEPDRLPTWDELKHAAYRLVSADVCFVLIFPRRSAPYVDVAANCLHLWESDKEIDL